MSVKKCIWVALLWLCVGPANGFGGGITREVWTGISGTAVSALKNDPRYPASPTTSSVVSTGFEAPTDVAENYGQRMHGYVVPPVTGEYRFWIASDDGGELWLSSSDAPSGQRRIAYVTAWTSPREWGREPNQESALVRLEAGRAYYVAALQKEGGGGDNLAVRWLRPDGVDEGPIPAAYLLPANTEFVAPRIVQQPVSATMAEGGWVRFAAVVDPTGPASGQWRRNGVDVPGGQGLVLDYGPVTRADDGARFRLVLTNRLGSVVSEEAVLTVPPDRVAPTVVGVLTLGPTTVRVTFSEPVDAVTGPLAANYEFESGDRVVGGGFGVDAATVLLTTTPLTYGTVYTLRIANVRDRASEPNVVAAGTRVTFVASEYAPGEMGGTTNGATRVVEGGYDVTGGGLDIGGTVDQGHFSYREREGDFDFKVRVAAVTPSDPFVQAGLMVRESLEAGARFAGVFAGSVGLGCFFESRTAVGARGVTAAPLGGFPANYPYTWLRLQRRGNRIAGYAGYDGVTWQLLSQADVALPLKVFFGMAVSGHHASETATARFRELGVVTEAREVGALVRRGEPLGPSNRRTGLVFSELMYHPAERGDGRDLEFVEIYNAEAVVVDLSGWRLAGAVEYVFPAGFKLPAGGFVVVAADPGALQAVYGIGGVLGPYGGRLNNAGDRLQLLNAAGAIRLEVDYAPEAPWPVAADGLGHALVLAAPSYGENDPRAWAAGERLGGTPGEMEAVVTHAQSGVVLNEFLAHTDDPVLDFIELFNTTTAAVDVGGCVLSDSRGTARFRIPEGTRIGARGHLVYDQAQLGFALSAAGETIYLLAADGSRVLDAVRFGGQENGVSTGRVPDGGAVWRRLAATTPGVANARRRSEAVVINEIMYHPLTADESTQYVELHNTGTAAVDLSGWRFVAGIDYRFPVGARLEGGGYVVVARDAARLRADHPQLGVGQVYGDFRGELRNSMERVAVAKPDLVVATNAAGVLVTNTIQIVVSEVTYFDGGRWPERADGGGSSLELIDPRGDLLLGSSWAASDESAKAKWAPVEFTGRFDLGVSAPAPRRMYITMLGAGECLLDDIEIFQVGSTNLIVNGDFEAGATGWSFFGNHRGSGVVTAGAFGGQNCLRVLAPGDGDTANNSIRVNIGASPVVGQNVTIRAKARWVAGWPEVLFRVRGNGIEFPARLQVPRNLGTPGAVNSRFRSNAGPGIYEVTHGPAVPQANEAVVVTCRVADPDGAGAPRLRFRVDPSSTLTTLAMRDDGAAGDAVAGDGVYSATLAGRGAGTLVAFRIECADDAAVAETSVFPVDAPVRECLVRWGDAIPFGSMAHYHMWNTTATETARNSSPDLDNTYRDCTLVYGNFRVIYNAGFRDKGSPYHGGGGDFAVTVPKDGLLLGVDDRVFGSTGNGGNEGTGMRGDVSNWIGEQMGIPFLHSHYIRVYRNGGLFRNVMYDLEQPNGYYARSWFGGGAPGDDLYKIAVWFEFDDNNSSFQATGADLRPYQSGGQYKLARYRWNWQLRPSRDTANDYSSLFNLVAAANSTTARVDGLLNLANMQEWMGVFAFNRILGNWDSWGFNYGQNMYLYAPLGGRATLMPWDIDFVLGDGNGTTDPLWGGHDATLNALFDLPVYRRMIWRAYQAAIAGPLQAEKYNPQIDGRRAYLVQNGITGVGDPRGLKTYIEARRKHIETQLARADTPSLTVTSNGGQDFTNREPVAVMTGTAPFAAATIEVNGVPYPATWTAFTAWRISVPLAAGANRLVITARDLGGRVLPGLERTVTATYSGQAPLPGDWVVINEIMYHAPVADGDYVELHNRHPSAVFDLSGFELSGAGYTFPAGTFIQPNGYLVVVRDRAAFAGLYGANIPVVGPYAGRLDSGGETLRLVRPGTVPGTETVLDEVRYDNEAPWPLEADGVGASLQLIDPAQDNGRAGNWAVATGSAAERATPGRANTTRATIDPFPALWINEVLPSNAVGTTDNAGEREPWIEIYNGGGVPLDLGAYFLSVDPTLAVRWSFPAGTALGSGQYLVVWADGEVGESAPGALHASFRLNSTNGLVTLCRVERGVPVVMDYVDYDVSLADHSFGSIPDGEPRRRRVLYRPTAGGANDATTPPLELFINEWLASNRNAIADPADADFEDWFEIYNAGTGAVDLSGYYLTDNLTNRTRFRIPNGVLVPPGGFRLVWADDEAGQNAPGRDVHTNFRLPADGGQIGLATPDGVLVDGVSYGVQTADVSEGRFPDGAAGPAQPFTRTTPGAPNAAESSNRAPILEALADRTVEEGALFSVRAVATDADTPAQVLTFSLLNAPAGLAIDAVSGVLQWVPTEDQGPRVFPITVVVTDSGSPRRSASATFRVEVKESNRTPVLAGIADATVEEGAGLEFQVTASDPDLPAQGLTFGLEAGAPEGATIDPVTGLFRWLPTEEQGPGQYLIGVSVADNHQPAGMDRRTFRVTVVEVDNPPVIDGVSPQSIAEGTPLRIAVGARDPDDPTGALKFSLETGPSGASIDAATGVFVWTPSEADGPRDHNVTVRVTEASGVQSSTVSFLIGVREINEAPGLAPIDDVVAGPGDMVRLRLAASDVDLPAQTLRFAAVGLLPEGATLDAVSGDFAWPIPQDPPAGVHEIRVRVTDDAVPPLAAERVFRVTVNVVPRVVINEILHWPAVSNAEFVELHNASAVNPVDMSGWRLEGYDFEFPAGTALDPGRFICVARNRGAFLAAYGEGPRVVGDAQVRLTVEGGLLRLLRPVAGGFATVEELTFAGVPPWPVAVGGASLQRRDPFEDGRLAGSWGVSAGRRTNAPLPVVTLTSSWKYWQAAAAPGAGWAAPAFNDGAWPAGGGLLYVETAALPAAKTTALTLGQISYYFRLKFPFTGNSEGARLLLSTVLDDGAVVYLNGTEVYRLGMPEGAIVAGTLANRTVGDAVIEGPVEVAATGLVTGDNTLAVEVHQVNATSSDIVFGLAADVVTVTAASSTPGAANQVSAVRPVELLAGMLADGRPILEWATQPGVRYRLEVTGNLNRPVWSVVFTGVGVGGTQTFTEPSPVGVGSRFYRVVAE